jgi:hypothetical protein
MIDVESLIRDGFVGLDPLPHGAEGDWRDVLRRVRRPVRRRRWTLAIAVATTLAAVVTAVLALLPAGGGGPSTAAAALNRLAGLIAAQPLTPQPGQYLYIQSKSDYAAVEVVPGSSGNCVIRSIQHNQIWIGTDGSGLDRETYSRGYFTSPADRAACLRLARTASQKQELQRQLAARTGNAWYAPRCLSLKPSNDLDWSSLSSDPAVLLQQIRRIYDIPPTSSQQFLASQEFSDIAAFLHDTDAPPAVRATLYRTTALIPGVRLLGTVRDHDGRPGLGVAYTSNGQGTLPSGQPMPKYSYELIFDQKTGELAGEQQTGVAGSWTVYLQEKVVNRLPSKPPAPLQPPCDKRGGGVSHPVPGGSLTNGAPLKSP